MKIKRNYDPLDIALYVSSVAALAILGYAAYVILIIIYD